MAGDGVVYSGYFNRLLYLAIFILCAFLSKVRLFDPGHYLHSAIDLVCIRKHRYQLDDSSRHMHKRPSFSRTRPQTLSSWSATCS